MPISVSEIPSDRTFSLYLDPHGELDYTIDWSNILGNRTIQSVTTTLSSTASSAGVEIISEDNDDTTSTLRLGVADADSDDASFDPPDGSTFAFKQTLTDSDGQIWEFSFAFTVVQQ